MNSRVAGRVAWSLWGVSLLLMLGASWLGLQYPPVMDQENVDALGDLLWTLGWSGFGLVGAIIVSRHPTNRVGWTLSGITALMGVTAMSTVYARADYVAGSGYPLGTVVAWLASWCFIPAFGLMIALVLLFPSGRLTRRRHHWFARALIGLTVVEGALFAVQPGPIEGDGPPVNPLGLESQAALLGPLTSIVGTALVILGLCVLADATWRWRKSRGAERQQFRWFALATLLFPTLFFIAVALEETIGRDGFDPVVLVFFFCGNAMAAAIGIAVTRYGLYEIGRVVSRSVTYLLLTVLLVAIYLAAVTILTAASAPVTGDSPLAVAAATLLAAAVFRPARRRIQATVDRRFNRARYDAVRTVDAYRGRLRDEVNIEALAGDLLTTVATSMQPAGAALWLRGGAANSQEIFSAPVAVTVPERGRETKGT